MKTEKSLWVQVGTLVKEMKLPVSVLDLHFEWKASFFNNSTNTLNC